MTTTDTPIVAPDDIYGYDGAPVARWGQGVTPIGAEQDPVPNVYASNDEIETRGFRGSLDVAERYAERILNAVRYQQARIDERLAAELNAMARGDAATHDWHRTSGGQVVCRACRTVAYGGERGLLAAGAVPVCGSRCRQPWHEISGSLPGEPGDAKCIFCQSVYVATGEAVTR